jgi:hypothetical protein
VVVSGHRIAALTPDLAVVERAAVEELGYFPVTRGIAWPLSTAPELPLFRPQG